MEQVQGNYVQVSLEVPRETVNYLDELAHSIGQNRRSIVRSMIIQSLRLIQSMKEPPSTLGDIENTIKGNER